MSVDLIGLWEMSCSDKWYFVEPDLSMALSYAWLFALKDGLVRRGLPKWQYTFCGESYTLRLIDGYPVAHSSKLVEGTQINDETERERRLRLHPLRRRLERNKLDETRDMRNRHRTRHGTDDTRHDQETRRRGGDDGKDGTGVYEGVAWLGTSSLRPPRLYSRVVEDDEPDLERALENTHESQLERRDWKLILSEGTGDGASRETGDGASRETGDGVSPYRDARVKERGAGDSSVSLMEMMKRLGFQRLCRVEMRKSEAVFSGIITQVQLGRRRRHGDTEIIASYSEVPTILSSDESHASYGEAFYSPRKVSPEWTLKILDSLLVPAGDGRRRGDREGKRRRVEGESDFLGLPLRVGDGELCAICLEPLSVTDERLVRLPTCSHWFHRDEILQHAASNITETNLSYKCCQCNALALAMDGPSPPAHMEWSVLTHPQVLTHPHIQTNQEEEITDVAGDIQTVYSVKAGTDPNLGAYKSFRRITHLPLTILGVMTHILMRRAFQRGRVLRLVEGPRGSVVEWNDFETDFAKLGDCQLFNLVKIRCLRHGIRLRHSDERQAEEACRFFRGDTRPGDMRKGDMRQGDTRKGDTRQGDVRPGDMRPGDMRKGDMRPPYRDMHLSPQNGGSDYDPTSDLEMFSDDG